MSAKQEIVRMIRSMSGRFSGYQIFSDWVECSALAISNTCRLHHDKIWQDREDRYIAIMQKYSDDEKTKFAEMLAFLTEAYEEDLTDVLGEVYMEAQLGSKETGQFFTPFHLSELCAKLVNPDSTSSFCDKMTELNEPSCGAGGMIIATAAAMKAAGIDYQTHLRVVAQDLDWRCVYMCYVQLSLLGIDAVVVQGDTLQDPYRKGYDKGRVLITPRRAGCLI